MIAVETFAAPAPRQQPPPPLLHLTQLLSEAIMPVAIGLFLGFAALVFLRVARLRWARIQPSPSEAVRRTWSLRSKVEGKLQFGQIPVRCSESGGPSQRDAFMAGHHKVRVPREAQTVEILR